MEKIFINAAKDSGVQNKPENFGFLFYRISVPDTVASSLRTVIYAFYYLYAPQLLHVDDDIGFVSSHSLHIQVSP